MELEEFDATLDKLRSNGRIEDGAIVKVRNPNVSSEAIEAGSDGWIELGSILVVDGDVYLEPEED